MENKNKLEVDGAAVTKAAPSKNTPIEVSAPAAAIGECRRSSRKKIIKFDVRDLLNKHRKPHKIQIEARIDSNAPPPSLISKSTSSVAAASSAGGGGGGANVTTASTSASADLSSKQKAFMEKSAIFRRLSISEQQNKIINTPPLPPPPPLSSIPSKIGILDSDKIAQARRLSRTQEIFSASLMKSKQNSSLIIAQIENNSCSSSSGLGSQTTAITQLQPQAQKKVTVASSKRKNVPPNTLFPPTSVADAKNIAPTADPIGAQKRRGRSGKLSKAPQATSTTSTTSTKSNQKSKRESNNKESDEQQSIIVAAEQDSTKMTLNKATTLNTARNWKEYKANLAKSNESLESKAQKRLTTKKNTAKQNDDVIFEISSTSSISEHEYVLTELNESQQRNFASVCIWQENQNVCETSTSSPSPEFIVAAVEEITTENREMEEKCITSKPELKVTAEQPIEIVENVATLSTSSVGEELNKSGKKEVNVKSSAPERASPTGRKSSGSESESSGSDRSNKSYKKGDKLRVSLKRMSLPEQRTSTSIEAISSPLSANNSSELCAGDSNSCDSSSSNSSGKSNNINSSGESNVVSSNELNTVGATNKVLPTRRSHRLPRKPTVEKAKGKRQAANTKTKININEDTNTNLNVIEQPEGENQEEKDMNAALPPVDLNAPNTTTESSEEKEQNRKEIKNAVKIPIIENVNKTLLESEQVETAQSNKKQKYSHSEEAMAKETTQKTTKDLTTMEAEFQEAEHKQSDEAGSLSSTISSTLYDDLPTHVVRTHEPNKPNKKERITLPLKKQVSKFKMYEAAVQDVAANVETSTLLDILNTVKQNNLTTTTTSATIKGKTTKKQTNPNEKAEAEAEQLKITENSTSAITEVNITNPTTALADATKPTSPIIIDTQPPAVGRQETVIVTEHDLTKSDDIQSITNVACEIEIGFEGEESYLTKSTTSEIKPPLGLHRVTATKDDEILQILSGSSTKQQATTTATEKSDVSNTAALANSVLTFEFSEDSPSHSVGSPTNLDQQSIYSEPSSDKTFDESSSEGTTTKSGNKRGRPKGCTKKTPSPTPTSGDSPKSAASKKQPTRRYERRSQRGNISVHKTLEETFAEIAAESSKAVLELKSKKVEMPEEPEEDEESVKHIEAKKTAAERNFAAVSVGVSSKSDEPLLNESIGKDVKKIEANAATDESKKIEEAYIPAENRTRIEIAPEKITFPKDDAPAGGVQGSETKFDHNIFTRALSPLQTDGDSNSNHSSPPRRGRKAKNKKETKKSPKAEVKMFEEEIINTAATRREEAGTSCSEIKTIEQLSKEGIALREVTDGDINKLGEYEQQISGALNFSEQTELTTMRMTETQTISEAANASDLQEQGFKSVGIAVNMELKGQQMYDDSMLAIATTTPPPLVPEEQRSTPTECAMTDAGKRSQNENLNMSPAKSRRSKRGTSSRQQQSASAESEVNGKEIKSEEENRVSNELDAKKNETMDKKSELTEDFTQEVEATVSATPEIFKNVTEQKFENMEQPEPATSNDESLNDMDTTIPNLFEQMLEQQRINSSTPVDKPKKVKKRKSTKTSPDGKSATELENLTTPPPIVSEGGTAKIVEPKDKSAEKEDVSEGKVRKSRKGKHTTEAPKDYPPLAAAPAENESPPSISAEASSSASIARLAEVAAIERDVLAKAPPKKRLLKMQQQYEEKNGSNFELPPVVEISNSSPITTLTTITTPTDSNKPKDTTQKKSKKETKPPDELTKRTSFDNQTESSSLDEESRSANSTPVAKRFKQQQTSERTPDEKTKSSAKRKSKWDQPPPTTSSSGEKVDSSKNVKVAEKDNKTEIITTTTAPSPSLVSPKKSERDKDKEKNKFLSHEEPATSSEKIDEKSAKKKRQKKLKEAFEAALNDALNKEQQQQMQKENSRESVSVTVTEINANTKAKQEQTEELSPMATATATTTTPQTTTTTISEDKKIIITAETDSNKATESCAAAVTTMCDPIEEDPDPLKDIEKFIEDGVNLLKRGYKIEDDSVDDEVICTNKTKSTSSLLQKDEYKIEKEAAEGKTIQSKEDGEEQKQKQNQVEATDVERGMITPNQSFSDGDLTTTTERSFESSPTTTDLLLAAEQQQQNLYYETPADTPVATPTTTPPPKSPTNPADSPIEEISGVRRSHRIKLITKTPKALVGRGLVREKERFSIKDDVEMKTHYSLDDHLTDLAQVEAKNAKFLKEMEERLSNFQVIKENEYKCERVVSREARKMVCDCFLTAEEEERGELGCGEDCLNRLLMIECGPDCNVKERCTNKRFQKLLCSPCRVFRTEKKGFGIMADIEILPGEFIMEYVGEVINGDEFEQRRTAYSLDKNRHYYFMALRSDAIIDATIKGNISRFINHSCDPNAETQKWTVNGELRIGFFSRKSIMPGEEITFDYQYQRYGREAQRCYCESANCRGWIGEEPNSDEGEQVDEDSDALADVSDEDESDSSADTDELQNKLLEHEASAGKISTATTSKAEEDDGKLKLDEKGADGSMLKDKKKKEDADDDIKAKLKKLAGKSATDKAIRKKRKIKDKKAKRMRTDEKTKAARYLEDPDIEDEVKFLSRGGLRNQSDTLRFSRLVVRAKLPQTRLNLLKILRNAELPCRRLFLDYHGLRLLHGWMSEDGGDMAIRLALLEALESLPIANKTVLTDSKVYQSVRNWCGNALPAATGAMPSGGIGGSASSPSDESSKESTSSNSMLQQDAAQGSDVGGAGGTGTQEVPSELQKLALKLTNTWNSLPEIFRIPKRERIEQMKEHEREADRQYAESSIDTSRSYASSTSTTSDRYQRDRFGRGPTTSRYTKPSFNKDSRNNNITVVGSAVANDPRRRSAQDNNSAGNDSMKHLSKEQRREMFAAKVARDEAEKRMAEERREFETKCRFFGLDPKKTRPQDVPFCVDPSTGQWFSVARQPIPTPPCYAHIQVQPKAKSIDPADYKLPALVATLPSQWKYAITTLGQIYYYHYKQRVPQWHPPTPEQLRATAEEESTDSESCEEAKAINESSEEDEVLIGMDEVKLKAYIDKKIEKRRNKRYSRLVDERPISPRKEEDRIYNQIEMRKYKENKEKIRKRKEDIRRKRAEALKSAASENTLSTDAFVAKYKNGNDSDDPDDAIPIQDYLLSSDEEEIMKAECNNSPLLEKIVQGDKIVDELDALTTKRPLKRPLPPHRDVSGLTGHSNASSSGSSSGIGGSVGSGSGGGGSEHKRRKSEKKEKSKKSSKESDSKYRRNKEKFRCEIAGIIVQHLKPYRKDTCALGRIKSDEDFNHLARKLTHFVMVKELKYCEAVGQTLVVTESVKNKSREFIKKYMAKYGGAYVKPLNDPEFKDIPFTI